MVLFFFDKLQSERKKIIKSHSCNVYRKKEMNGLVKQCAVTFAFKALLITNLVELVVQCQ